MDAFGWTRCDQYAVGQTLVQSMQAYYKLIMFKRQDRSPDTEEIGKDWCFVLFFNLKAMGQLNSN